MLFDLTQRLDIIIILNLFIHYFSIQLFIRLGVILVV